MAFRSNITIKDVHCLQKCGGGGGGGGLGGSSARACLDFNDIKISLRIRSKTLLQGNIYFINTSIYISPNPIRYFL